MPHYRLNLTAPPSAVRVPLVVWFVAVITAADPDPDREVPQNAQAGALGRTAVDDDDVQHNMDGGAIAVLGDGEIDGAPDETMSSRPSK